MKTLEDKEGDAMSKTIREWQDEVHATAVDKGWHERSAVFADGTLDTMVVLAWIGLAHSELSEALEEARVVGEARALDGVRFRESDGKPEGFGIEMADVVIRIMDTCAALGVDLERAIKTKAAFNKTRPHRHGGKLA